MLVVESGLAAGEKVVVDGTDVNYARWAGECCSFKCSSGASTRKGGQRQG